MLATLRFGRDNAAIVEIVLRSVDLQTNSKHWVGSLDIVYNVGAAMGRRQLTLKKRKHICVSVASCVIYDGEQLFELGVELFVGSAHQISKLLVTY